MAKTSNNAKFQHKTQFTWVRKLWNHWEFTEFQDFFSFSANCSLNFVCITDDIYKQLQQGTISFSNFHFSWFSCALRGWGRRRSSGKYSCIFPALSAATASCILIFIVARNFLFTLHVNFLLLFSFPITNPTYIIQDAAPSHLFPLQHLLLPLLVYPFGLFPFLLLF